MSAAESDEFSEVRGALGSIGLSAIIVLGGTILNQAMGFGTRIVMTRFLPVDGYGEVVLGITVLNLLGLLSVLGLTQAMTRYIPLADNKTERTSIAGAIYQIGIVLSIFWAIVGYMAADAIAGVIFSRPNMAGVIRIFSLSLPFYVLFKLTLKGIQGHKETTPNILTKNLVLPATRLGAVGILALSGYGVLALAIGYNLAFAFAALVGALFFIRAGNYQIRSLLTLSSKDRYRELLGFSVPLAVSASFGLVTKNTDRFLLGALDTSSAVGIYDVAFLVAQFILFFGPVLNYLFQPIMAEYDADGDFHRMDKLYTIITRWLVILTFPVFALLVLFPETMLGTFFGSEYRAGGLALAILASGFFAARLVGLSGSFLIATGETKVLMYVSGATAALNLGLNVALIPIYGIIGAAIATVGSTLLNNGIQAAYVYRSTGIHPFTRELLLPTALVTACLGYAEVVLSGVELRFIQGFMIAGSFAGVYLILILITRSVYVVELKLVDSFLEQIGIRLDLENRLEAVTVD